MANKSEHSPEPWQRPAIEHATLISKKSNELLQDLHKFNSKVFDGNWPYSVFRDHSDAKNHFHQLESTVEELRGSGGALQKSGEALLSKCKETIVPQGNEEPSSNLERSKKVADAIKKKLLAEMQTDNDNFIAVARKFLADFDRPIQVFAKIKKLCQDEADFLDAEARLQRDSENFKQSETLRANEERLRMTIENLESMVNQLQQLNTQVHAVIEEAERLSQCVKDTMINVEIGFRHEARISGTLDSKEREIERLKELLREASA